MEGELWIDDKKWEVIEKLIKKKKNGENRKDDRRVISGIIKIMR